MPPERTRGVTRSARKKQRRKRLLAALGPIPPALVAGGLRLLASTWRVSFSGAEDLFARWDRGEKVIIASWHNRLLMMAPVARGRRLCIMVSAHRDGELATRALGGWGIHVVRGSASRGGVGGFLGLVGAYRAGHSLAVLPDGPRGPVYVAKPGVIHLGKATGAPIFPVVAKASRFVRLGSWDHLIVPLPFARVSFVAGPSVRVARGVSRREIDELRSTLEATLTDLTRELEGPVAS